MADLKTFAKRIRERGRRIEQEIDRSVILTAIAADQSVVSATPVDTGRARANWQVGLGTPVREILEEEDTDGQATNSRNAGRIRARKGNQTIYLSNNVEYIGLLNNGSSSQAPENFVAIAVNDAIKFLRRRKIIR